MSNVVNFRVEKLKRENEELRQKIAASDNRMKLLTENGVVI